MSEANNLCFFLYGFIWQIRVYLDCAKNSVTIEELRIINEDSEKIVIFRLAREWWQDDAIPDSRNIIWIVCWE
jgi:hypothetical protein